MPIPVFRPDGYLPQGLYLATFQEIAVRFGTSTPRRQYLLGRLERWVEFARGVGALRFFVNGSFVTQKLARGMWMLSYGYRLTLKLRLIQDLPRL